MDTWCEYSFDINSRHLWFILKINSLKTYYAFFIHPFLSCFGRVLFEVWTPSHQIFFFKKILLRLILNNLIRGNYHILISLHLFLGNLVGLIQKIRIKH